MRTKLATYAVAEHLKRLRLLGPRATNSGNSAIDRIHRQVFSADTEKCPVRTTVGMHHPFSSSPIRNDRRRQPWFCLLHEIVTLFFSQEVGRGSNRGGLAKQFECRQTSRVPTFVDVHFSEQA